MTKNIYFAAQKVYFVRNYLFVYSCKKDNNFKKAKCTVLFNFKMPSKHKQIYHEIFIAEKVGRN